MATPELRYQTGFWNDFETEAVPGALPEGRNFPQQVPHGLYAELTTGTPFTSPRSGNLRTWTYRIQPSTMHGSFSEVDSRLIRSGPFVDVPASPEQLRWNPLPIPEQETDFVDGLVTIGGNGDPAMQSGVGIHLYAANASMRDRFFYDADGELLIVPQQGTLRVTSEMGVIEAVPNEICVVPRGIRFRVELPDRVGRGFVCENYGRPFRLPELGPIGSSGLANSRDFKTPVAAFEESEGDFRLIARFQGRLWSAPIDHSPLDVVAWHGNYAPYKYDLLRFNTINSVSYDHPDPSIFTVLTSPTAVGGTANVDFVVFAPRWSVANDTFRPPPFHRNVASEFLFLIEGEYHGKGEGFFPGVASLHNSMSGHGPDAETFEAGTAADLEPQYLDRTLAAMFETQLVIRPTRFAMESDIRQTDYRKVWQGLKKRFSGT